MSGLNIAKPAIVTGFFITQPAAAETLSGCENQTTDGAPVSPTVIQWRPMGLARRCLKALVYHRPNRSAPTNPPDHRNHDRRTGVSLPQPPIAGRQPHPRARLKVDTQIDLTG